MHGCLAFHTVFLHTVTALFRLWCEFVCDYQTFWLTSTGGCGVQQNPAGESSTPTSSSVVSAGSVLCKQLAVAACDAQHGSQGVLFVLCCLACMCYCLACMSYCLACMCYCLACMCYCLACMSYCLACMCYCLACMCYCLACMCYCVAYMHYCLACMCYCQLLTMAPDWTISLLISACVALVTCARPCLQEGKKEMK